MSAFASTSDKGEFIAILRGFSAGGAAAVLSKSMTAPLDRVKLLLQLQNRGTVASTSSAHYTGVVDCFKRVCLEQGVRSLWRGNSATVLRSFPTHALNFVMRDYYRLMFLKNVDRKVNYGKFVMGNILAGACGGMTSLCLVYPLDLARTRLAVETKHRGIYDCLRSITQKEGFAGMYRGFFVSLQFVALSRAAFFGMFDTIRGTIAEDTKQLHFFTVWFIAQTCVVTSAYLCYPADTIRRKLMMQSGQKVKQYNGTLDCLVKTFRNEGVTSFYRGALPNSLRSTSGALMVALYYEAIKYM